MHTPRLGVILGWNRQQIMTLLLAWFCTTYYIKDLRKKKEHADFNKYFFDFLQATYISQYMSNLTDKLKWKPTHKLNREKIGHPI
jgi:hypothetical protein